jgi:hypothetical protein
LSEPIFIVGIPRSGTTWLWGLFTSLPGITPCIARPGISESAVFLRNTPEEAKKIIDALDGQVVEKTPHHLAKIPAIRSVYPNAPIVLIERDIRDVIASMRYSRYASLPWSLDKAIMHCRRYLSATEASSDLISHRVSYESLAEDTFSAFFILLRDLGLHYSVGEIQHAVTENHRKSKVPKSYRKGVVGSYSTDLTYEELQVVNQTFA